jgi:hypothetical protein
MFSKQNLNLKRIIIIVLTILIIILSCSSIYLYFSNNKKLENFAITCPLKGFTFNTASYKFNNRDIDVTSKLSRLLSQNDTNILKTIVSPQLFNYINISIRNALTLNYCCNGKEITQTILDGSNLFSIGGINCSSFTTNFINGKFVRIIGNPNYELNLCGVLIYNQIGNLIFSTSTVSNPIMKTTIVSIDGTYNINPNTDLDSIKTPAANVFKILTDNASRNRNIITNNNIQNNNFQKDDEYTSKSNGKILLQNQNKEFVDYWQYRLSSNVNISAVEIYCRSDCCIDNSTNLKLQILNQSMNVIYSNNFPNQLGTQNLITDSQRQICYVSIPIPITTTQTTIPIITTQPLIKENEQSDITELPDAISVPTKYNCNVNDYLQDECNMNATQNCTYFNSKCFNNDELSSLNVRPIDNTYYGNFRGVISKNKNNKYTLNIYNDKINSNTRILIKCISSTDECSNNLITSTNSYISSNDLNLIEFYNNKLTSALVLDTIPTLINNKIYITDVLSSKAFGIVTTLPSIQIGLLPQPPINVILNSANDLSQVSALQSLTAQSIKDFSNSILQ